MPKGKVTSKSQKTQYQMYQSGNRCVVNRTKRLEKYVKNNPNDIQAKKALKKGLQYRRKSPMSWHKTWSPEMIEHAHRLRVSGSNGNLAIGQFQQKFCIFK
jgi:hypothetical protein